jgi:DNA-binding response OmpR family regulator
MTKTDTPSAGNKKRILIVEDEKPLAHALELKMTHEGYETTVASTGSEGLKEAVSGTYDLILLDLILPEVDGFAILEALKEKKAVPVVIILSNLGQDEDRKRAEEYGVEKYLVKSNIPLADIVNVVKATI